MTAQDNKIYQDKGTANIITW